jgi:hypothetical protein
MRKSAKDKKYLIFSERCSGSNVVEELVIRNFGLSPSWVCGYKHWPNAKTDWASVDMPLIVVSRNPIDYFKGLYRKPWHAAPGLRNLQFGEFIRAEWWNVYDEECRIEPGDPKYLSERMDERDPITGLRFENVCKMRSSKLGIMRDALLGSTGPKLHIDSLSLICNQGEIVEKVAGLLSRPEPRRKKLVVDYKGGGGWRRRMFNKLTLGRFSQKSYSQNLDINECDISWIWDNLDEGIEGFYGYRRESSESISGSRAREFKSAGLPEESR